ncbi:MAG: non-canonical purine NTP diphosphatase [Bacteroidota bacterium]
MKLCFATTNPGKIKDINTLLSGKLEVVGLKDIGCSEEIEETEDTMEGNSLLKAKYVFDHYKINCFADDSGLEVDALNGEPGVYSARYAGPERDNDANIKLLLSKLEGVEERGAQFKSIVTLVMNGEVNQFEGIVRGTIINEKRGNQGFGYDPIFMPEGLDRTFAEISIEEKNKMSHRRRAIDQLIEHLKSL